MANSKGTSNGCKSGGTSNLPKRSTKLPSAGKDTVKGQADLRKSK